MALFTAAQMAPESGSALAALRKVLEDDGWIAMPAVEHAVRPALVRLCALYLTSGGNGRSGADPVARLHLGNGARLERINWMSNPAPRGLRESYGITVNYLYDLATIEANHEAFVREGIVTSSLAVTALLAPNPAASTRRARGK
jgi:malonyl-CoA decarboxylase